jgi:hypothetical protein
MKHENRRRAIVRIHSRMFKTVMESAAMEVISYEHRWWKMISLNIARHCQKKQIGLE